MSKDQLRLEQIYCEILKYNIHLLEEMFTVGSVQREGDYYFIAHRSKLWVLDINIKNPINIDVLNNLTSVLQLPMEDWNNVQELFQTIVNKKRTNSMILFGFYDNKNDEIVIENEYFNQLKDHNVSTLVAKVKNIINPAHIRYRQYGDYIFGGGYFFHGTSSIYLKSILKKGIDYNSTNYNHGEDLKKLTAGKIFLTTNYNYARTHAREVGRTTKGTGIVLQFKLRFEDMLQPDYDVSRIYRNHREAEKVSKEMGVYAYKGRILPNHIENIHILNVPNDITIPGGEARDNILMRDIPVDQYISFVKEHS